MPTRAAKVEILERLVAEATEVKNAMAAQFSSDVFNPIDMMVGSGARGNMMQVRQIVGPTRDLVANPRGDMIPQPIESKSDSLIGLKENFIIGKLIPAGTGMLDYRQIGTRAPGYEPMTFWSSDGDGESDDGAAAVDPAKWLAKLAPVDEG